MIYYQTFSQLREIPYLFPRYSKLTELSTHIFISVIHNIFRQEGELTERSGNVIFSTEIYIQGLLKSKTLGSLKSTADLVDHILSTYKHSPEVFNLWIIKRKGGQAKASSLYRMISLCTPSVAFGLQFFQQTLKEVYHDSSTIKIANHMFDNIVYLLRSFDILRTEFYASGFDRLLLSFPLVLREKLIKNQVELLKLDYTTNNLKAYDFKSTPECKTYLASLQYFVNVTQRLGHPDLQKFMIDSLASFFEGTLGSEGKQGTALSLFFQGFKILSKFTFQQDYTIRTVKNLLEKDSFISSVWGIMLCYIRSQTKEVYHTLTSRRAHLELLTFLQDIFETKDEIISEVIFERHNKDAVVIDNTSWIINMVYETSNSSVLKINETFSVLLRDASITKILTAQCINLLRPESVFAELLVARLYMFYFYQPDENIAFLKVLSTIIFRTSGAVFKMNGCAIANAIKNVYHSWRISNQMLLAETDLTDELILGDSILNTLPNDSKFRYWKFFCKSDPELHLELRKNIKENHIVFDDVLCTSYCLNKLFYFVGERA